MQCKLSGDARESRVPTFGNVQTHDSPAPRFFHMGEKRDDLRAQRDLQTEAITALEEARAMPHGPARSEALKRAGRLQKAADTQGLQFAKRGRPRKT